MSLLGIHFDVHEEMYQVRGGNVLIGKKLVVICVSQLPAFFYFISLPPVSLVSHPSFPIPSALTTEHSKYALFFSGRCHVAA